MVTVTQAEDDLVIAVADIGKGILATDLSTLFDEYRQVEGASSSVQEGTGLGLSITKRFAELLGGSIDVESEVGKSSTFTVKIPFRYRAANEWETQSDSTPCLPGRTFGIPLGVFRGSNAIAVDYAK